MDYIHYNPVKHGLVPKAGDWQYSTFQRYARAGIYDPGWGTGVMVFPENEFGE
jgi:putative transposase